MATDSEKNRETDPAQTPDQAAETDTNAKADDTKAGEAKADEAKADETKGTSTKAGSTKRPEPEDSTDAEGSEAGKHGEGSEDREGSEDAENGAASDDDETDDERAAGGAGSSARDSSTGGGFVAGATAVVSAGLGLTALVGSPLSEMMRTREEFVGQIEGGGPGNAEEQIEVLYSSPWHLAALVNGVFGLVAIIVGGVLLAAVASRADTRSWVKSVALGGVILGAIGLLVSLGMYFDLFASTPSVPAQPTPPGP